MALTLTPEEQAALDKRVTNQPAESIIPSDEDILNGSATGNDVLLVPASGLDQDIIAAQDGITQTNQRIADTTDEISMANKVMNYYHDFLRGYENEIKYINGTYETSPWDPSEASEANNIFNDAATRYFPSGKQTNPLQINSFAEELGGGPTAVDTNNILQVWSDLETVVDFFTTTYTNTERINDVPDGAVPPPTPTEIADYEAAKQDIIDAIDAAIPIWTTLSNHLAAPFFDQHNPGADTAGAARKAEVDAVLAVLTELDGYTTFPDANLATFQSIRASVASDAASRITEIGTFALSGYYELRKNMAIELADFGEGLYYKRLQDQDGLAQQQNRLAQLQRKKASYDEVAGIL